MSKQSSLDKQVGGDHYKKYKYQPMQFAEDTGLSPMIFSALKYICRHKDKGKPVEDLKKALHCVEMFVEHGRIKDLNNKIGENFLTFVRQFDFSIGYNVRVLLKLQEDKDFLCLAIEEIGCLLKEYE